MLRSLCRGMIIGFANIMPGVSGGTMAISMGIYDKLIHCITHFFVDFKENMLFLAPILAGMSIAIIASVFGLDFLFQNFPVQTNMLFIGLILGSLPTIYGKVKKKSIKIGHLVAAVLFFVLVVGMAVLNGSASNSIRIDTSLTQFIILFLIGIIASGTMVIPGVSGSMILLLLGYYNPIISTIKEFFVAVFQMNFDAIGKTLFVLIPFGLGVVLGSIVIAKIIEFIFKKFPMYAYWSIIGLLVASPIAIIMVGNFSINSFINFVTGMVIFVLGWEISSELGEK